MLNALINRQKLLRHSFKNFLSSG